MKKSKETDPGCPLFCILFTLFYHLTLTKGVIGKGQKRKENVRLHYVSL